MERKTILLAGVGVIVLAIALVYGLNLAAPASQQGPGTAPLPTPQTMGSAEALAAVRANVQEALDRLDAETATAANRLGPLGITDNETRAVLRELALVSAAAIDATAVSKDGIMLTVEPVEYHHVEGSDIHEQEHVRRLIATQKPVMSRVFETVEGINATDIEHPVFTPSGAFNGSASLLFRPVVLLTIAVEEALAGRTAEVFVVDTDGVVLYDRDPAEIGANTFSSPQFAEYPELQQIAGRMIREPNGSGEYTFRAQGSTTPVRKRILWTTVGLHGTEWRVVAVDSVTPA
ncbi:MAG TPA: cache domain-containing protein [Methanoregulaceae archaeon]|nr:cache domain-containing protein [Methanoregulaceae archaeon]